MEPDTIFRIYSMTKPITSIALMQLYERGKFHLAEPVSRYIPQFGNTKVLSGLGYLGQQLAPQNPPMTIHHLLTHTAGLSYGFFLDSPIDEMYRNSIFRSETATLEEKITGMAELPLRFQPGAPGITVSRPMSAVTWCRCWPTCLSSSISRRRSFSRSA